MHRNTHRREPFHESEMIAAVAFPTILEAFFGDQREPFAECIEQRRRRSVVILMAGVIAVQQLKIEIPGLHGCFPSPQAIERGWGECDWRQSRRATQTLLGAAIGDV